MPFALLGVLAASGCTGEEARNEILEQANAQCARIVVEMRADLLPLFERANALAADDEKLLRRIQYTTQAKAFRNPNPCFGYPSLAADTPQAFGLELEASLTSLRADFDNAGRRREYDALEDARVRSEVSAKIERIRALAQRVARSD